MIKLLPNILSLFRLITSFALIPFVLKNDLTSALFLFALASISDFFDGYVARKFLVSSEFGAMLDPLADKVLMTVSYILFAYVKFIPVGIAVIVVARDFLILLAVAMCKFSGVDLKMKPLLSSKINTALQLIFIVLVLACNALLVNIQYLVEVCAAIVGFSTIFSGAEYVQKYYWIKGKVFAR
ncbi:MAG: CDP-alcohol phosphatidyltransferase family protein [Holosporaceae bacterium]|jgi:cardiolipin synthase|nr:CDP-alcohol phosphatidyltransferase family protein [Holosporaceae bacterium]